MISDFWARAQDGELGRQLSDIEIDDAVRETELFETGYFESPGYLVGQAVPELLENGGNGQLQDSAASPSSQVAAKNRTSATRNEVVNS